MKTPNLGDCVQEFVCGDKNWQFNSPQNGTVIYVHPELRYYTVLFQYEFYSFKESFLIGREIEYKPKINKGGKQ